MNDTTRSDEEEEEVCNEPSAASLLGAVPDLGGSATAVDYVRDRRNDG